MHQDMGILERMYSFLYSLKFATCDHFMVLASCTSCYRKEKGNPILGKEGLILVSQMLSAHNLMQIQNKFAKDIWGQPDVTPSAWLHTDLEACCSRR